MAARPAVILLSGGLDSATTLAIAKAEGYEAHAMSFRYGQRHAVELEAARRVAAVSGVARHVEVDLEPRRVGAYCRDNGPASRQRGRPGRWHPEHIRPCQEHCLPLLRSCVG